MVNPENSGIGRFGIELVGEDNIVEPISFSPFLVSLRRIGFTLGVRVVVDHLAVILIDIFVHMQQIHWIDDGEIVRMFSGISGGIVLNYPTILSAYSSTGFIGITSHHVC